MNYIGHMARFILISLIFCLTLLPSYSALKGGVNYGIPIDYSKLNQAELESKADKFYYSALKSKTLTDDMTSALNMYTMLKNAFPENIIYSLRLGKLYDVLGKDRYAKGNYYFAMNVDKKRPEPYYYLGDYYYTREQYRKALKMYLKASDKGYSAHSQTQQKINIIYKKLGEKNNTK